jgi:copper(I)-binding protein
LKTGTMHAMLVGLPRRPKAGKTIKGMFVFEKSGTAEIEYPVGAVGVRHAPAASHHHR